VQRLGDGLVQAGAVRAEPRHPDDALFGRKPQDRAAEALVLRDGAGRKHGGERRRAGRDPERRENNRARPAPQARRCQTENEG
jgi:hypothetical protein